MREHKWTQVIGNARIDVEFKTEGGKVMEFSVNLSYIEGDKVFPVIRYDTAHGYPHVHRYWVSTERLNAEKFAGRDYGELLTEAYEDIRRNYERYIELFKQTRRKEGK